MNQNHFEWLEPDDNQLGAKLFDYPDLFREAADALRINGYHHESLSYYEPLQHVQGYTDASYFTDIAICYKAVGMKAEAKECYQAIIDYDDGNVEARLRLAQMYEELGMPQRAGAYVENVLSVTSQDLKRSEKSKYKQIGATSARGSSFSISTMLTPCSLRQTTRPRAVEKERRERAHTENAFMLHLRVQQLIEAVRKGDVESKTQWMAAAKNLIQDFRLNKAFYPYDKHMKFLGYPKQIRTGSVKSKGGRVMQEVQSLAGRLHLSSSIPPRWKERYP